MQGPNLEIKSPTVARKKAFSMSLKNKKYNHCNTTTTNNGYNNDSEIQRSKNTHPAPPQWDILSTTSDTTATSDNGRLIHIIPRISIEEQLREIRLKNIRDCTWKQKS